MLPLSPRSNPTTTVILPYSVSLSYVYTIYHKGTAIDLGVPSTSEATERLKFVLNTRMTEQRALAAHFFSAAPMTLVFWYKGSEHVLATYGDARTWLGICICNAICGMHVRCGLCPPFCRKSTANKPAGVGDGRWWRRRETGKMEKGLCV
ncbi:hypothetical protein K504DRAFT_236627 [Pleomassaria siparia CBS 279.74]|uniref:Uncharacterized protein n=1 Tax=Pleomassaria siparia CBS 279.74 TaxID=1314801 RepID=A0A6G1KEP7_9PLEO|nr:hypothetical protein K504DRAFT_236627 [Pleomassaria siparia CBS 279.74]